MKKQKLDLKKAAKEVDTLCPKVPKPLRELFKHMSKVSSYDYLDADRLANLMDICVIDLDDGFCSFNKSKKLPIFLDLHRKEALACLQYFPQIIDACAEPEFAQAFREICKRDYDFDPPYLSAT